MLLITALIVSVVTRAIALPANPSPAYSFGQSAASIDAEWNEGAVNEYPIHSSCNATETTQLRVGLREMEILADHAKQHILRWSNSSEMYRRYFGDQPSAIAVGAFDRVVNGDKGRMLFRCDDPDGNCQIPEYGGHWRGENATDETVICQLSYSTRRPLSQLCALGYNVAEWPTNTYFASDLLHRVYHMPAISEYYVDHYTEDYQEVLDLATNNNSYSVRDSDTLQYFALEAYAHDIAVPGIGCPGPRPSTATVTSSVAAETETAVAPSSSGTMLSPSTTVQGSASAVLSVPQGCHTHEGGELHCE